jgi:hypothetical protein
MKNSLQVKKKKKYTNLQFQGQIVHNSNFFDIDFIIQYTEVHGSFSCSGKKDLILQLL